jgi:Zn-dependent protease with chaperone function
LKINGMPRWTAMLSTHPPLADRIAALEQARLS